MFADNEGGELKQEPHCRALQARARQDQKRHDEHGKQTDDSIADEGTARAL